MKSDIPMDFTEYLCYSGKGPFNEITAISEGLRGFLNCKPMDLKFNRRAREPILIDTLETCFHIAGGPQNQSGNILASHLSGRGWVPSMASSGKAGSCVPLVSSLKYRTLNNCMY